MFSTNSFAQSCLHYFASKNLASASSSIPLRRLQLVETSREKPNEQPLQQEIAPVPFDEIESKRTIEIVRNYFSLPLGTVSKTQFARKLQTSGAEESGSFDLQIEYGQYHMNRMVITVNNKRELMLTASSSKNIKIIKIGSELVLQWMLPNFTRCLSFTKDDLGNITSVIVDDTGSKRLVIMDQPIRTTEKTRSRDSRPTVSRNIGDAESYSVVQQYFKRYFGNSREYAVKINFSKFADENGKEHLAANIFSISGGIFSKMYIGTRALGIWAPSRSPVRLVPTNNKSELHLQWNRENSIRRSVFHKDELGNISSLTIIDEIPNESGEPTISTKMYYN